MSQSKIQRSEHPALFFSKSEKERIVAAIQMAEKSTSGEIRVHLERKIKGDVLDHAKHEFERLGMANTEHRNGVLFFLGVHSHRFAILGDAGIHEKVDPDFWNQVARRMSRHFQQDRFADGLVEAILAAGDKLREFFPFQRDDVNELPDEISCSI